jgi:hypothetical protein
MTTQNNYFAIVTFGAPDARFRKVHTSESSAVAQASELKGSGTCSAVRVLGFAKRVQAADADISDHCGRGVKGDLVASY